VKGLPVFLVFWVILVVVMGSFSGEGERGGAARQTSFRPALTSLNICRAQAPNPLTYITSPVQDTRAYSTCKQERLRIWPRKFSLQTCMLPPDLA
jgi:hypothetical protein